MSYVHFLDVFDAAGLSAGLSDRDAAAQARSQRLAEPSPRLLALLTCIRQQPPGITVNVVGGKEHQPVEWVAGEPPRVQGEGANCALWSRVNAHEFSSDDALVLSGSDDLTAGITKTSSGQRARTLGGNGKRLHRELSFGYESFLYRVLNPDGPGPISNLSKRIGIVERITRSICHALLRALRWHDQPVMSVALSPDGREALTAL